MYRHFSEGCTFSNTETVTCSVMNTVNEVLVVGGQTTTTSYTESSSGVNAPPTNPPLYFTVTITAGLEKIKTPHATGNSTTTFTGASSFPTVSAAGSTSTSRMASGAERGIVQGKWTLLGTLIMTVYLAV